MLTQDDMHGVCGMMITPAKEGADKASFVGSNVNLEEAARVTEAMIQAGVGSLALCGTTGEGHSLTWEEKYSFIDTVSQVNRGRIPIFAGATTLGTRETIKQMKALRDIGAPGAFVGLALWQTPTIENASNWYKDLGENVPDMAVMVYANSNFFKTDFPLELWQAIVAKKAHTVITCKMSSSYMSEHLEEILRACGKALFFMPGGGAMATYETFQKTGTKWRGYWSTAVNAGPEPLVALADALAKGDMKRAEEINADMRAVPHWAPPRGTTPYTSREMNVQGERLRGMYSDFMKTGPLRPPYTDVPPEYLASGKAAGAGWAQMRKKYIKTAAPATAAAGRARR